MRRSLASLFKCLNELSDILDALCYSKLENKRNFLPLRLDPYNFFQLCPILHGLHSDVSSEDGVYRKNFKINNVQSYLMKKSMVCRFLQ